MAKLWRQLASRDGELVRPYSETKLPIIRKALVRQYSAGILTYLYLPGVAGNYASVPDAAALDIVANIDVRVKVQLLDWKSATLASGTVSKWAANNQVSWLFNVRPLGTLRFAYTTDGAAAGAGQVANSTIVVPFTNELRWIRATRNAATGDVTFYYSTNGTDWTQLGDVVATNVEDMFSGTSIVEIGSILTGATNPLAGQAWNVRVFASLDGSDERLNVSFTDATIRATSVLAATGQTITINSTGAKPAAIVDGAT